MAKLARGAPPKKFGGPTSATVSPRLAPSLAQPSIDDSWQLRPLEPTDDGPRTVSARTRPEPPVTLPLQEPSLTTVLTTTPPAGGGYQWTFATGREFRTDTGGHRRYPYAHLGNPRSAVQSRPFPPGSYLTECPKMSAKMSTAPSIGGVTLLPRSSGLGRKDSNLRMGDPKSPALPLGDAPPSRIRLEELDRPRRPEPAETPVHGTCLWRPGTRPGASKAADRPRTVIG